MLRFYCLARPYCSSVTCSPWVTGLYAILHRIQTAKRLETRARRVEKYVGMLAAGDTPCP